MTRQLVLMVSLALVLLLARSRGGEARVRLNSIRTVILREGHALPLNRSTWEPSLDLTVSVCVCDVMIVIVTCVSEWRSNPTHAPCVPPPLTAVSVHERPGVQRGQLLSRPHQRPRPLTLPDLPQEEEALP